MLTVKGLEGSTDLPASRTGITGRFRGDTMERVLLHPRDHGVHGEDIPWSSLETWRKHALAALAGDGPLAQALVWHLGCFLWLADQHPRLAGSMDRARTLVDRRSGEWLRRELLQQAP